MRLAFSLADEDGVNIGDREPDDMVLVDDMIVVMVEDVVEERKREGKESGGLSREASERVSLVLAPFASIGYRVGAFTSVSFRPSSAVISSVSADLLPCQPTIQQCGLCSSDDNSGRQIK